MHDERVALVTGANQGVGSRSRKELVAHGLTVLVGSRNLDRGEAAAEEIGPGAIRDPARRDRPLRSPPRRSASAASSAASTCSSTTRRSRIRASASVTIEEYAQSTLASNVSLDEVRAVWETNVFGVLAVYQAMLPLLRESPEPHRQRVERRRLADGERGSGLPVSHDVRPGLSSVEDRAERDDARHDGRAGVDRHQGQPGLARLHETNLNGYEGTESVEDGSREVVRVALLGPDGPTGTFTRWETTLSRGDPVRA